MSGYDHTQVQEFWQWRWEQEDVYTLPENATDPTYVLGMFPYTSGSLHMGHVRNYAITDAIARYRRMQDEAVLHPMGWDAFGLPAENAAEERLTDPESWTRSCIDRMRDDMESLGFGYDWSREITTCDPDYYQWNQWLFLQLLEEDLVDYRGATVNWCPDCETSLADAQVDHINGEEVCWRCETPVTTRELDQWFFTITEYADELLDGLDELDGWQDSIRERQRNWIGRQEGWTVTFEVPAVGAVETFTTRLDTIYGATYIAVAPTHDLAKAAATEDPDVADYLADPPESSRGVKTGFSATHPRTGEELPVYVGSYVLEDVGTGAVMGVPAHNERDFAFARANGIPVQRVIEPVDGEDPLPDEPFTGDGMLTNSDEYDGLASAAARSQIAADSESVETSRTYRLNDWLISRQRYWGTPIPIVHCADCGAVPVPESDLPIELPDYEHTTGNPLEATPDFIETTCPECGGDARRETDTMDTFVDSSWYFLRFLSPEYEDGPVDPDLAREWMPIDVYVGGEEHAVLHLLYIRFMTKALADLGLLEDREPVTTLRGIGTVLYDGEKMSKTKRNVVAPHEYGPETTRFFVLSAAHPTQDFEWTAKDVGDAYDFQQTVYDLVADAADRQEWRTDRRAADEYLERAIDRSIVAVTAEYDRFRFHRVAAELRELARLFNRYRNYGTPHEDVYRRGLRALAAMISPMTPHLGEELWNLLRGEGLVVEAAWPEPTAAVPDYDLERTLIHGTREDVREIIDVVDIEDPEQIELVVAQDWKHRAYEQAREADAADAIVGEIQAAAEDADPDRVSAYAGDLEGAVPGLDPVLAPDTEREILTEAAWLFEDEFGATLTVRQATDGEDLAERARPGKPAIRIE